MEIAEEWIPSQPDQIWHPKRFGMPIIFSFLWKMLVGSSPKVITDSKCDDDATENCKGHSCFCSYHNFFVFVNYPNDPLRPLYLVIPFRPSAVKFARPSISFFPSLANAAAKFMPQPGQTDRRCDQTDRSNGFSLFRDKHFLPNLLE